MKGEMKRWWNQEGEVMDLAEGQARRDLVRQGGRLHSMTSDQSAT